jgi:hypothetical protein
MDLDSLYELTKILLLTNLIDNFIENKTHHLSRKIG